MGAGRQKASKPRVAILVAHPDDETLWSGGLILRHPEWNVFVATLCRRDDPVRDRRFFQVMKRYGAQGAMGAVNDSEDEPPVPAREVEKVLVDLLPHRDFDLIITHSTRGEYTRHLRHEEVAKAVLTLWTQGAIRAPELWQFAYDDHGGSRLPLARHDASLYMPLPQPIWEEKLKIITGIYKYPPDLWEARSTPRSEAFQWVGDPGPMARRELESLPASETAHS